MTQPTSPSTENQHIKSQKNEFSIIGVGASAGGLEALKSFFEDLPAKFAHSFVVVQHLSPDYKSLMGELLSKNTDMPIIEVKKKTKVEPGTIYLLTPKKNIFVKDGHLLLENKPTDRTLNLPIDLFFKSLAREKTNKAIAVILSGTGSDGTSGARDIKEFGGMVMVQDPEQAEFESMPQNAINTHLVDYVLPTEQMGEELQRFMQHPAVYGSLEESILKDEETLIKILNFVNSQTKLDFEYYKRPTLIRMIARRIGVKRLDSLQEYKDFLLERPEEAHFLIREFLVGVTSFFRDDTVWDLLTNEIIPKLIYDKKKNDTIKCWCVGVSSGEEAYSLAIIINEELAKQNKKNLVKIFATDIEKNHLKDGSKGIYNESSVSNIPEKRLLANFTKKGDSYHINENIRRMVIFSKHNVLKDPPFNKMDISFCRNMLIYLQPAAQNKVLDVLHYSLNRNGILVLGSSESLGRQKNAFEELHRKQKIYRNIRPAKILGLQPYNSKNTLRNSFGTETIGYERNTKQFIVEALSDNLHLASIVIDGNFNIVDAYGELSNYISLPNKGFSMNLLKMVPESIAMVLSYSIRKVGTTNQKLKHENLNFSTGKEPVMANMHVASFQNPLNSNPSNFLVIIKPVELQSSHTLVLEETNVVPKNTRERELESELKETRESLKNMIEEVETSNEELQATNEELLASNEELQSTNEELQSVNEELHTVNAELQEKIEELAMLNSDLDNLFKSTDIGTVFLDKQLRIRKFTPSVAKHFNLLENDVNRPLEHFASSFHKNNYKEFISDIKSVIINHVPKESEVKDAKGQWFLQKIVPFQDGGGNVAGATLSYVDINKLKSAEQRLQNQQLAIEQTTDSFWDLNIADNTYYVSHSIAEVLGYHKDEIEETIEFWSALAHPGDLKIQIEAMQKHIDSQGKEPYAVETRYKHKLGHYVTLLLRGKIMEWTEDGQPKRMIGTTTDVSMLKKLPKLEQDLLDRNMVFEQVLEITMAGFWDWNIAENSEYLSPTFKKMFGYEEHEMTGSAKSWQRIVHPDDLPGVLEKLDAHVKSKGEIPYDNEIRYFHKNGSIVWVWCKGLVIEWGENGEPKRMVGSHINITQLKQLSRSNKELERFAYVASHDLQEPLRTIRDFVALFKDEYNTLLDNRANTYLEFIEEASSRMGELVKVILAYSKIGSNTKKEIVNLKEVVENVQKDLQIRIDSTKTKILIKELPTLTGHRVELHSLFLNLIGNSIKFISKDESPRIEIGTLTCEKGEHIYIRDNGIGIDKKNQEHIFQVFKRLHNQEDYEGTGIGLAHCKKIVELHNGKIWVESEMGKGSTFHFNLNL
ncbi:chemotaxis protein CheB [Zobellia galactanivorans]|uniref:chemotaxis protein CheB n=1 Tax=Zobellia galactanivorans (strain DSM 12802 / CCUG 47099 / CIP 106680 / NCIMB 13871 / Dsij) TaxID=63186 RepID=UPI001C06C937|nr:chemotaxis protein CheB [Zobellia galactanivorans]MBU3024527.1 PAS domain-containing protein [Zobellia galactanivorans]